MAIAATALVPGMIWVEPRVSIIRPSLPVHSYPIERYGRYSIWWSTWVTASTSRTRRTALRLVIGDTC